MLPHARSAAPGRDSGGDALAAFRIGDAAELLQWLQRLRDGSVPVMLGTPQGAALAGTLQAIDMQSRQLGFGADAGHLHLQRLVQDDEATAVAYLDQVKLQFDLCELVLVRGAGACTLRARLPAAIYRFQRRDSWRVRTPERGAPTALLRHPSLPDMRLALRIVDLGAGGCALLLPHDMPALQPGTRLAGVHIRLGGDSAFEATLQLQHVSAMHGDAPGLRLGCEFAGLDGAARRALQRWIDRTQQRQRRLGLR